MVWDPLTNLTEGGDQCLGFILVPCDFIRHDLICHPPTKHADQLEGTYVPVLDIKAKGRVLHVLWKNCARACVCVSQWKKSARRMESTTSDTGDTSSKQQQAQRMQKYTKRKRPVSSVDHCHPYIRKNREEKQFTKLRVCVPRACVRFCESGLASLIVCVIICVARVRMCVSVWRYTSDWPRKFK